MKTLYESILGSTKTGARAEIEKWCDAHNLYDKRYIINSDNTVSPYKTADLLYLHYDDYSKIPDYIKFKTTNDCILHIGPMRGRVEETVKLTSFEGLPKEVNKAKILLGTNVRSLPPLSIKVCDSFVLDASWVKEYQGLTIEFTDKGGDNHLTLRTDAPLKNVKVIGANILNFVNDFNIGDAFSKAMNRKAQMNKYRNKYEIPVSPEAIQVINTFFTGIDMSTVTEILYTQNSKLVKFNGQWYRCKNW